MTRPRAGTFAACLGLVASLALVVAPSCSPGLAPGGWGEFRFIGRVKGQPPLDVLPPISDRTGNIYTLYGAIGLTEVAAFVSRASGGSFAACSLTKGDVYGAHGWAGFTDDRAWYWSGDALVLVSAAGACTAVLDHDPSTNVDLRFLAVMPWVHDTPSRRSLVALIESPADGIPFSALVDLDLGIATNLAQVPVSSGSNLTVLGVGADHASAGGFVVVVDTTSGVPQIEALFYDADANLVTTAPIAGSEPPPEYGIVGYLQIDSTGLVAGLTGLGSLLTFTRAGGVFQTIDPSVTPVGLHLWDGALWLVGTVAGNPVVLPLGSDGQLGAAVEWTASEQAAAALEAPLTVVDDRSYPQRATTWPAATPVPFPFLHAHSPWPHAPETTLWTAAGPQFATNGPSMTDVAVAPVGIRYP